MSPSAAEEAGKVGISFIGALRKEWPLSLALVFMNICLLVFCYIILDTVSKQREREVALMYGEHKEVREMLGKCIIPPPNQRQTDLQHLLPDPPKPTTPLPVPDPRK
jgi:hypothetical protein